MPGELRRSAGVLVLGLLALAACRPADPAGPPATSAKLRLATTTSTYDTGLLDALLPDFEAQYGAAVEVIAVGTGQALQLGARGDVDVVLVHARAQEDKFVADGHGLYRLEVMYNDFVVVGPRDDPAGIAGLPTASEAFARIAERQAAFASRGDDSGTHAKEMSLWQAAGLSPAPGWYFALGQGMGETLIFADEKPAYTLADRGTWLAQSAKLRRLSLFVGGASIAQNQDPALLNPYGVIPVNPQLHPSVNSDLAVMFAMWITSIETQANIETFGQDRYRQSLFYPNSDAWRAARK